MTRTMAQRSAAEPAFPVLVTRPVVVGAVCWTLSAVFFIGQAVVQAASTRHYSLATNVISDLGNTACGPSVCSPLHTLMNTVFIATGVLHWAGAVAIGPAWPPGRLRSLGQLLLALAGAGLATVGVFPENVSHTSHVAGALVGLVSLNAGMIVLGAALPRSAVALSMATITAGILGSVGLLLFLGSVLPTGISERIADYPGAVMIVVLGATLLVRSVRAEPRSAT